MPRPGTGWSAELNSYLAAQAAADEIRFDGDKSVTVDRLERRGAKRRGVEPRSHRAKLRHSQWRRRKKIVSMINARRGTKRSGKKRAITPHNA